MPTHKFNFPNKALCLWIFILSSSHINAQSATGVIFGEIRTDSSGSPIANARIALEHTSFVTLTNKDGAYRLPGVPTGVYQLRISAPGYRAMLYDNLTIIPGIRLDFSIKLRVVEGRPNIVGTMRLAPLPKAPRLKEDPILIYQPDSTIDFKLRIVNPEKSRDSTQRERK
jgi:hypothetical protein